MRLRKSYKEDYRSFNKLDKNGNAQLSECVKSDPVEKVVGYLAGGAKPDILDVNGMSPIDVAKSRRTRDSSHPHDSCTSLGGRRINGKWY